MAAVAAHHVLARHQPAGIGGEFQTRIQRRHGFRREAALREQQRHAQLALGIAEELRPLGQTLPIRFGARRGKTR